MSALTSTGTELRRFRRGLLPKIAIGALILIPLLYGALYLWAFWDPTGRMERLPVALVDSDRPVTLTDGTVLSAGREVTTTLLDSAGLDWVSTDAASAQQGVKDGTYYFALSIPTSFSSDIASAEGDNPTRARLDVTYNDANSFLASTLGHSAMVQVDDAVRATIGDASVGKVLVGLGSARDGFATASDGAITLAAAGGQLTAGTVQVADGVDATHDGAARLAAGAVTAESGATELASGAHSAAAGATSLSAGAASLAANLQKAQAGSTSLTTGATSVSSGASTLATNLRTAKAAGARLDAGAAQLSTGVSSAVSQISTMTTTLDGASPALTDALSYLNERYRSGDLTAAAPLTELSAVASGLASLDPAATARQLGALTSGAADLASGASQLDVAVGRLSEGADQLATGSAAVASGASQLAPAVGQLSDGATRLASGAGSLTTGATALAAGADRLSAGTTQLASGTAELADQTSLLATGAHALADGAGRLTDGAGTLADGLTAGATAIPDDSTALRTTRADVLATPVALDESHLTKAQGFGEGFAPFFIPLALFVGSLITWLLFRPLPARALATPASGLRATFAGFLPAAVIGAAQVAVMLAVIHFGVGLRMSNVLGVIGLTLLVAVTFIALQQMLIALLGPAAGKVAILALLMLQLASSGGTYPVETTPAFFRAVHGFLPMSYAVTGLREVITGGIDGRLWSSVAVLGAIALGSLTITSWRAGRMRTWTLDRLHPALAI